jgi:flavin-dependent dehydrogenase
VESGVTYVRAEAVGVTRGGDGTVTGVRVRDAAGREDTIASDVLVDSSGMSTFLSTQGVAGRKDRGAYDRQLAVFSQVEGAIRDPGKGEADTIIFYQKTHHWAWFIPLDDKTTSVGVVVPSEYFRETREDKPGFLRRELRALNPELDRRLPNLDFTEEVRGISNYSYEVRSYTGKGFLCVGDSHRFIDPVFSFGLFVAMKEGEKAAAAIADYFGGAGRDLENPFAAYERETNAGLDVLQEVIDAFWSSPLAFAYTTHSKHVEGMIDLFAGRIYMREPSSALMALRRINESVADTPSPAAAG